jgi:hypothetical protein
MQFFVLPVLCGGQWNFPGFVRGPGGRWEGVKGAPKSKQRVRVVGLLSVILLPL